MHRQLTDAVFTPVAYFSVTCSSNIIKSSLFKVILVQKYVDDRVGLQPLNHKREA